MGQKILLAEDTADMNKVVTAVLEHDGYEVDSFLDGKSALKALMSNRYDAALLDIMMPGMTGIEVLKEIRSTNDETPVILLTAKSEIEDKVDGLDAGANDYLTKPFSMKELLARIRSLLRTQNVANNKIIVFSDIKVDSENLTVSSENTVGLSNHEYELIKLLINNFGRELDTDFIKDHIWDDDDSADADTVWLYISYLKEKLDSISSKLEIKGEKGGQFILLER
ncbi:MAG: response regulator transcription factor [Lachnospiraceae bacterium]|jgi:DNA-binding response OmpR family regulator|nr:response regulator transcription factor [Lachnospiraceae bacterium]